MEKKTPIFLAEKVNIVKFLIFVTVFALTFIFIYEPFNGEKLWQKLIGKEHASLYMSFLIAIGFVVLIISRLLLYKAQKKFTISYVFYILWMILEISFITLICTLVAWSINTQNTNFSTILPRTFYYTVSILLIPYTVFWLYFSLKENEKLLNIIKKDKKEDDDETSINNTKDLINLKDENGNLRLSIKLEHLYYMESANNYIYVYYENSKKELSKSTLRSSLKIIEESFPDIGLIRCHRSYIINFKKVKVLRKDKEGLKIELDYDGIADIPVSKTYVDEIIKLFSKHSV
ncbi:MAG TPA: LytTR family DNA-binding domain-containing protein [Bacteroidales bacterium]|nr:LytTR family DNA-binding domain-containing protein [Bacteroidales bacterium]HPJ90711.1 LytTR family DNA-binding domain-containing protein [Bacteroidales bacterium]